MRVCSEDGLGKRDFFDGEEGIFSGGIDEKERLERKGGL